MRSCQIKGLLNSSSQKNNLLKKLLILIALTSIYNEKFTGCVSDWNLLNSAWPIRKVELLTLIRERLFYSQILNPCSQTCIKG